MCPLAAPQMMHSRFRLQTKGLAPERKLEGVILYCFFTSIFTFPGLFHDKHLLKMLENDLFIIFATPSCLITLTTFSYNLSSCQVN